MKIIDCHVYLSQYAHDNQTFSQIKDSLLRAMKEHRITCSIVYPDSEKNTGVSDLETTLEVIHGYSQLFMLGTTHIPTTESGIIEKLDMLAKRKKIVGIKLYPGFELFYPDDERCHAIYNICVNNDIPIVFHSGEAKREKWREKYNHPNEIAKVAEKYKDLKIVIAHFSQPHLDACKEVVLEYDNVYADISGLAYPDILKVCGREEIERVLELVIKQNPEKILFGTDWPICNVGDHLKLVNSLGISGYNKAMILAGNAEQVFSI